MTKGSRKAASEGPTVLHTSVLQLIYQFHVAARSTNPDMTLAFHARPHGRFIEIQSNLRRMKLHVTNQRSNFLGISFGLH